ncbi:alanine dehydrogenase [Bradyrhizobium diazoefficiens]
MRVGVPKEIKVQEYRVGLTPGAVREYVAAGHQVTVETGAGSGIGASDEVYRRAGAEIAGSARDVFASSDMIVKVKEPQKSEWTQLRESQILFTYLHLAPDPEQAKGLLASGCTAIAYETVTDAAGHLPLLAPMSEVAGRLAIEAAGAALKRSAGGRGLLLGGVPGVQPARLVVLGGGVVGTQAARMAAGLGAEVTVIDRSIPRLRELDDVFLGRVRTRFSTIEAVEEEVFAADVVIGAVLVPGRERAQTRHARDAEIDAAGRRAGRRRYRPGRLLRDVACDHAHGPDLRGRRHRALLRRQHAGCGACHVEPGAEQRDAAVRPDAREQGFCGGAGEPAFAQRPECPPWPHHQQGGRGKPRAGVRSGGDRARGVDGPPVPSLRA